MTLYWRWRAKRLVEKILLGIVWRLPRKLVYWCAVRVMTYNYGGSPDSRTCTDALKGWEPPKAVA